MLIRKIILLEINTNILKFYPIQRTQVKILSLSLIKNTNINKQQNLINRALNKILNLIKTWAGAVISNLALNIIKTKIQKIVIKHKGRGI